MKRCFGSKSSGIPVGTSSEPRPDTVARIADTLTTPKVGLSVGRIRSRLQTERTKVWSSSCFS